MIAKLMYPVVDCPDPAALAGFYARILDWEVDAAEPSWVWLTSPAGERIAFQEAKDHRPPRWPDPAFPQQFHLDFEVDTREDVERARGEVIALGAEFLHDSGGKEKGFLVFNDPAGHPFCLCFGQSL